MAKIDVVYILRNSGTRWRNEEIRYSLRALEKNIIVGNVFIVGVLPKFIDESQVNLIKAEDPYSNKLRNAIHKISLACKDDRVSNDFILMNDDFFFLQHAETVEFFNKGKLANSKKNHSTHCGYYYRAICSTLDMLVKMGIQDPTDFEVHYPIIFNKEKFLKMVKNMQTDEFLFRSVYGNTNKIKSTYRCDVKIFNREQLKRKMVNDLISVDETMATDPVFQKFIMIKYKTKSRFEKTPKMAYLTPVVFNYRGQQYNPGDIIVSNDLTEKVIKENKLKVVYRNY